MNILFLSIGDVSNLKITDHGVYTDLLREFCDHGHNGYVICPRERRHGLKTELSVEYGVQVLRIKIGNITKTNILEKGLSTILIEPIFMTMIRKYFRNIRFDLVLYTTPPITFSSVVRYVKKRDGAKTYLLLKDIFPQNAVDLKIISTKSILYKYFRYKEQKLYSISDYIGCMSQANVDYILKHNPKISANKVDVCPNSVQVRDLRLNAENRNELRNKYEIPLDKIVFIYGGNLGKPQGIPFVIECLKTQEKNPKAFFLIVGDGTEYRKLERYINEIKPINIALMKHLPKDDYDCMIAACDIGMIFLDHRFTIPNFPSRILSYMQARLPVLACTDPNTDIGKVIVDGGFGWWCESNQKDEFNNIINYICENFSKIKQKSLNARSYLEDHYTVDKSYNTIIKKGNYDG